VHDWTLIDNENVQQVVTSAARQVALERELDADDLQQDAWILVTNTHTDLAHFVHAEKWGALRTALYRDLLNATARGERIKEKTQSFDVRHGEDFDLETESSAPVSLNQRVGVTLYDRELVQSLLPAVWDEQFCWGMQVENAPDADMPRTQSNKATGNTLAAHLADIRSTWETAPLTLPERQALFLVYGLDFTNQMAGSTLGITHQTVSERALRGVGKIVATLNGDAALLDSLEEELVAA